MMSLIGILIKKANQLKLKKMQYAIVGTQFKQKKSKSGIAQLKEIFSQSLSPGQTIFQYLQQTLSFFPF
ncbi:hypothetical protein FGO68_gene15798 [Halteria grandinella]|uniref:Uncharacterized protein n=1 Tax=Halteria grandinella TaxID=5974 RepID=A0A8J8NEY0_HALGN|nr:hypothetical protein FGO68_gene15798 [Halteria grandinella]